MKRIAFIFIFTISGLINILAQTDPYSEYYQKLDSIGNEFYSNFYQNYAQIYSAEPENFLYKIQEYKEPFQQLIIEYQDKLNQNFINLEQVDNDLFFDRFIIDYPYIHQRYNNQVYNLPDSVKLRLQEHLKEFNNPKFIELNGYNDYVKAFIHHKANELIKQGAFTKSDNKKLEAQFHLLTDYFSNSECYDYWAHYYLKNHIENFGVKNINSIVNRFNNTCTDSTLIAEVKNLYNSNLEGREGHKIITYKTVTGYELDLHLFLPDTNIYSELRPAILFFHGGSWTEGKPDWFFGECKSRSKEGWLAVAVEYRIADRHNTLPFEALKDAKYAIRWVREHARDFNIDTNKIVVSGNSAGGHLALCTELIDNYDEPNENLKISSKPNLILINSGVYNLKVGAEWIKAELVNNDSVKYISPVENISETDVPVLMIHGTDDRNVPIWTAKQFYDNTKDLMPGVEYNEIHGAGHFLWFNSKHSTQVEEIRDAFLKKHGY